MDIDQDLDLGDYLLKLDPHRFTVPTLETASGGIKFLDAKHTLHNSLVKIRQVIHDVTAKHGIVIEDITLNSYSSLFDPAGPQNHPLISIGAVVAGATGL